MPPETIRALATEIVNQTILNNWLYYVILAFIAVVLSVCGAFLSAYFVKRAERLALTADFDEVKRQLKESTSLSESIKVDIQHLAERSEKLQWLKREKLEDYVVSVLRGAEHLSVDMYHRYFDAEAPKDEDPLLTASMLQKLYLPELDVPHSAFLNSVGEFKAWVAQGIQQRIDQPRVAGNLQIPSQDHRDQYSVYLAMLNNRVMVIEQAAKELARELNRV